MRINQIVTIAAGTPVNIGTGLATSDNVARNASRYHVQMLHGGTGLGYVLYSNYNAGNAVPTTGESINLVAELPPATATAPSFPVFEDWDKSLDRGGIDMTTLWIDGSHTGDKVLVSYEPKI